jgi:nicotinate-nucleotide adenylyltransferase
LAEAEADAGGVGLFGGTFDPPHVGHLVVAANVRWALGLEEVLVVVANEPWQKAHLPVSPAGDRLARVEAAVDGVAGVPGWTAGSGPKRCGSGPRSWW